VLESVWRRYRSRGVQFLGVDHRDDRHDALAFRREFGITYSSVYDPSGTLSVDYGLIGIPTTFVIGADGRIRYEIIGKVTAPGIVPALRHLLRTQEIRPSLTDSSASTLSPHRSAISSRSAGKPDFHHPGAPVEPDIRPNIGPPKRKEAR